MFVILESKLISNAMSRFVTLLNSFAARPNDSKSDTFDKLLILTISLCCGFSGLIWSLMYYVVFDFGLTMLLPLGFIVIVGSGMLVSHFMRDHRPLLYAQLACITWISAFIQWSIGSMENSGWVICWSFLGPLGALIFLSLRQAILWMIMFIFIVIVSAWYEPALLGTPLEVSEPVRIMFYVMNIGTSLIIVFIATSWFVRRIKNEKRRSDKLADRLQALFGQHVSKEIAEELITKDGDVGPGKYFDVSVMFVDIRNFTTFAESRAPREVSNFQNLVFGEFINIVREHKGIVLQALGDGIMAVFGAPVENEEHALDAIQAGYAILKKVQELSDNGEIPVTTLGIGLHSGKVIAGEVGNEFRKFYILSGSNVIVAARIEQLNKEYSSQFLISKSVYDRINQTSIEYKFKGEQLLKGISKPVGIYQLV